MDLFTQEGTPSIPPAAIESIEQAPAETPDTTPNIFERAICLSLQLARLGVRKKVRAESIKSRKDNESSPVTVDADADSVHVTKDLIECKTYEEIVSLDGEIRSYIASYCLPAPMFRAGVYLVPNASVEKIDRKLEAFKAMRERLVEKFCNDYPARVEAAAARLGALYDPTDYPSVDKVRKSFGMLTQYVAFQTPARLKAISADIWRREQDKARAALQSATENLIQLRRAELAGVLQKMIERLTPKEDGSAKVFRDTLVTNVDEFLETFNAKNITGDAELAALVENTRKLMAGVNPELLRGDKEIAARIREGAAKITERLDCMIVDRPSRKINFDA